MRTLTSIELTQTQGAGGFLEPSLDNLKNRILEPGIAGVGFYVVFNAVMKSTFSKQMAVAYTLGSIAAYNIYDIANS